MPLILLFLSALFFITQLASSSPETKRVCSPSCRLDDVTNALELLSFSIAKTKRTIPPFNILQWQSYNGDEPDCMADLPLNTFPVSPQYYDGYRGSSSRNWPQYLYGIVESMQKEQDAAVALLDPSLDVTAFMETEKTERLACSLLQSGRLLAFRSLCWAYDFVRVDNNATTLPTLSTIVGAIVLVSRLRARSAAGKMFDLNVSEATRLLQWEALSAFVLYQRHLFTISEFVAQAPYLVAIGLHTIVAEYVFTLCAPQYGTTLFFILQALLANDPSRSFNITSRILTDFLDLPAVRPEEACLKTLDSDFHISHYAVISPDADPALAEALLWHWKLGLVGGSSSSPSAGTLISEARACRNFLALRGIILNPNFPGSWLYKLAAGLFLLVLSFFFQ